MAGKPVSLAVYCSGAIPKSGRHDGTLLWGEQERSALCRGAVPFPIVFLDPNSSAPDMNDSIGLFGRDMFHIREADAVIIDARERRGLGVGVEALASRLLGTPLVAVVPPNSHYRADEVTFRGSRVSNYTHPHLAALCDAIVDDFEAAGHWLRRAFTSPSRRSQSETIESAIARYEASLLATDVHTLTALRSRNAAAAS